MKTALGFALLALGCTANIDGGSNSLNGSAGSANVALPPGAAGNAGSAGTSTTPPSNQPPSAEVTCSGANVETSGHRVLRRLTNLELETTLRATFGLSQAAWAGVNLPSDAGSLDGFTNNVGSLTVGNDYAKGTLESAKKIATLLSADAKLGELAPCAKTGDAACADTFVSNVGEKLYRRPLSAAEKARYSALYEKVGKKSDFKTFAYWAATAMLQSPHLIYRSEVGESDPAAPGRFKLSPYEIATELAYTFTGGPPSDALKTLAASNQLATAEQIATAARGLVYEGTSVKAAFRDVMLRFADEWLALGGLSNLKKDAALYPSFTDDVQASMGEETRRFFSSVVFEEKGNVASLFTAPYTYVDAALAKYYGFGASASDFARVMRPANWGVGLLSQGSLLAVQANALSTSPTRRGYLVRTRVLCGSVPPPPPVVGEIPAPTAAQTTRQRYETLHTANASCKGCHAMMDQIGFGLEHFDAAGRYREMENGVAIDDSATITGTTNGDLKVTGQAALASALAQLSEVTSCVSSYLGAYALGLNHESAACLVNGAAAELKTGGSLLDFYVNLAKSEHFRSRQ